MIYGIGILGFVVGFLTGQMILLRLLRHKTKDELLSDKHLWWRYGILNWAIAILSCYSAVWLYIRFVQ